MAQGIAAMLAYLGTFDAASRLVLDIMVHVCWPIFAGAFCGLQDCSGCFDALSVRVRSTEGHGMRWLHLQCLPAHRWASISTASIQGFNFIAPAEQVCPSTSPW